MYNFNSEALKKLNKDDLIAVIQEHQHKGDKCIEKIENLMNEVRKLDEKFQNLHADKAIAKKVNILLSEKTVMMEWRGDFRKMPSM